MAERPPRVAERPPDTLADPTSHRKRSCSIMKVAWRQCVRITRSCCQGALVKETEPSSSTKAWGDPDLDRYRLPASIWRALESGHVMLVRMTWLIEYSRRGGILTRRQDLPPEAFISLRELQDLYGEGNPDSVLPIIAISYCWETASHPDPHGTQLAKIASTMEAQRSLYAKFFGEMGVMMDWISMYQKERTPQEQLGFQFALTETMDLWYAHQGTTVYMLTAPPERSGRSYSDSGWPTYERCSAEQIKKFFLLEAKWKLCMDLGREDVKDMEQQRAWPIGPEDFDTLIETKKFTNGADSNAVKMLFRKMSAKQLGGIKKLDFFSMKTPNVTDCERLGRCLNLCRQLETLDLAGTGLAEGKSTKSELLLSPSA